MAPNARNKGKRAEREVVAMFRANGFPKAARSPMSGGMRPYGARDSSPWPGDLSFVDPYIVEVKNDEKLGDGGVRTWMGSTFVTETLRRLTQLYQQQAAIVGRRPAVPVLFARTAWTPREGPGFGPRKWCVMVPMWVFGLAYGTDDGLDMSTWVEIGDDEFWNEVNPVILQEE